MRVTTLFVVGILLAQLWSPAPVVLLVVGIISIIAFLIARTVYRNTELSNGFAYAFIVVAGFTAHSLRYDDFEKKKLSAMYPNESIVAYGRIVSIPSYYAHGTRFIIYAEMIERSGAPDHIPRNIVINVRDTGRSVLRYAIDRSVPLRIRGVLGQFPYAKNPGAVDWGNIYKLNNLHATITVDTSGGLVLLPTSSDHAPSSIALRWRLAVGSIIESYHDTVAGDFLRGLLLADRAVIPSEINDAFIKTGTVHIIAVSGTHVGIIAMIAFSLFSLLRMPRRVALAATIPVLIVYMYLTGNDSPVVRATIMSIVFIVGSLLQRKSSLWNSLAFSAFLILAYNTDELFKAGFQLSFASVGALILFTPRLIEFVKTHADALMKQKYLRSAIELACVSIAAILGVTPFVAYFFNLFPLSSFAVNMIAVPIGSWLIAQSTLTLILSLVSPTLAIFSASLDNVLVRALYWIVQHAASLPYSAIPIYDVGVTFFLIYYVGLVILFSVYKKFLLRAAIVFLFVIGNLLLVRALSDLYSEKTMRLTALSVRSGSALCIEFPNRSVLLIREYTSSTVNPNVDEDILRYLRYRKVAHLNKLILVSRSRDITSTAPILQASLTIDSVLTGSLLTAHPISGHSMTPDPSARVYVLQSPIPHSGLALKFQFGTSSCVALFNVRHAALELITERYASFLKCDVLMSDNVQAVTNTFLRYARPSKIVTPILYHTASSERFNKTELHDISWQGAAVYESTGTVFKNVRWNNP